MGRGSRRINPRLVFQKSSATSIPNTGHTNRRKNRLGKEKLMVGEAKQIDGEDPSAFGSGGLAGRKNTLHSQTDVSASNRGPENLLLKQQNPSSSLPPITDRGTVLPIWYSFELVHRRMQEGGWTHQITERELPS